MGLVYVWSPSLVTVLGCVGALVARYRKVTAVTEHRDRPRVALVPQRRRGQRRDDDDRPRRDRPARAQRRRQVHADRADVRVPGPSTGTVTLDGEPLWRNEQVYRKIGLVPEREALFDYLTGRQFVVANAELHGLADPARPPSGRSRMVEMTDAQDRAISTYSKGMRQRIKMASALVHDPAVLLLDEPFNGMDPRQRMHLMDLLRSMGAEGRTVLFSSHILEEVEQVARQIEVVVAGRHAASGDFGAIRRLMTDRPNLFVLRSADDRRLASVLLGDPSVRGARLRTEGGIEVEASDFGRFSRCCRGWPASTASGCTR